MFDTVHGQSSVELFLFFAFILLCNNNNINVSNNIVCNRNALNVVKDDLIAKLDELTRFAFTVFYNIFVQKCVPYCFYHCKKYALWSIN